MIMRTCSPASPDELAPPNMPENISIQNRGYHIWASPWVLQACMQAAEASESDDLGQPADLL